VRPQPWCMVLYMFDTVWEILYGSAGRQPLGGERPGVHAGSMHGSKTSGPTPCRLATALCTPVGCGGALWRLVVLLPHCKICWGTYPWLPVPQAKSSLLPVPVHASSSAALVA
jgi:hypothetical protein